MNRRVRVLRGIVCSLLLLLTCVSVVFGTDISSHVQLSITTNKSTYNSGETAVVSVNYSIDQGAAAPGDTIIITIPENIISDVDFSVSPLHFSSVQNLGGGQYALVLGPDAGSALSGSFSVYAETDSEIESTGTIHIDEAGATVHVVPAGGGESGTIVGYETEVIMKDGTDNQEVAFGDYDYSEGSGNLAIQIGLIHTKDDLHLKYRLFVNRKNQQLENVIVTDTLPDGMYFDGNETMVKCWRIDPYAGMRRTDDPVEPVSVNITGQTLTVNLGNIVYPVEVEYQVFIPSQEAPRLRNHSEVVYMQDGNNYLEHRDYILQGYDYKAISGVKSVDKTQISDDPADQFVTYTLTFWDDGTFAAGTIHLVDELDPNIDFLYADSSAYFSIVQDTDNPQLLHITNTAEIPARTTVTVRFVCDFSRVPIGYTVENTTGGNTTRTTKIGGAVQFEAVKLVNGSVPEKTFQFELRDGAGVVLQTRSSDSSGKVKFDKISYSKEDLGENFNYMVVEIIPTDDDSFVYDNSVYDITVTVGESADERGVIPVSYAIQKSGKSVDSIIFENKVPTSTPTPKTSTPTPVTLTPTMTTNTPTANTATSTRTTDTPTLVTPTPTLTPETPATVTLTMTLTPETLTQVTSTPVSITGTPFIPVTPTLPATGFSALRPQMLTNKPFNIQYRISGLFLEIPALNLITDIVHVPCTGYSCPIDWLENSVGLLDDYSLKGTIITGHNHLSTAEAGPFALLKTLEVGDRIFITDSEMKMKIYTVIANVIVDEDDFRSVEKLVASSPETITMLTCEDERNEGGYAHRRVIAAVPIK